MQDCVQAKTRCKLVFAPYNRFRDHKALPELVEKAKPSKDGDAKLKGLKLKDQP